MNLKNVLYSSLNTVFFLNPLIVIVINIYFKSLKMYKGKIINTYICFIRVPKLIHIHTVITDLNENVNDFSVKMNVEIMKLES